MLRGLSLCAGPPEHAAVPAGGLYSDSDTVTVNGNSSKGRRTAVTV
jgi:hypothetical protein